MAATGKSAIACTVATALQDRRLLTEDEYLPGLICLGGSFFFDKNISDQKTTDKVLPTLARNLANALPDFKGLLSDQIQKNPGIDSRSMRDKWKILLGDPLTELAKTLNEPLTIAFVIDALDECEATEVASVAIVYPDGISGPSYYLG